MLELKFRNVEFHVIICRCDQLICSRMFLFYISSSKIVRVIIISLLTLWSVHQENYLRNW